ncbi:MAG: SPOR domain-containing protein [candidate division KSB1 bacterium]|nr:SPOR domain-containing protein [candidate division KSB1 bacterium]MDZ7342154.1 SPOR domain-containing protein [candidate division KSB1 bacterium]
MNWRWSKLLLVLGGWLLFAALGQTQDEFMQFTYYDQVRWSPDGKQLAFRCILLDEARPEIAKVNLLLKDLHADQMMCLDPQPERFRISQDKKYLLFSSAYGLYLISLEKNIQPVLVYFREPTADWFWQDFGFYRDRRTIYLLRSDRTGAVIQENHRLKFSDANRSDISWLKTKKLNKEIRTARFNLPMEELNQRTRLKIRNKILAFEPKTDTGAYQFVCQSVAQPSSATVLIKSCRPRLIIPNPDSTEVIVSVFEGGGHRTYRFSLTSSQLTPIADVRYLALSWLDAAQYICLSDSGLYWRSIDRANDRRLDRRTIAGWCQSIDLTLPQFEIQVSFEKDEERAKKLVERLRADGYAARMKYVKDLSQQGYRIRVGGFKTRDEAQQAGRQLKSKGYGFWIDALTDWYDYFSAPWPEERQAMGGQTAAVQYRLERYLRSRIVVIDAKGTSRIAVDEMNNIPDRTRW